MRAVVIAVFFMSSLCFSQEEITTRLGDFHTLKTYRGLQVELIQSKQPKVIVEGSKASAVTIKNSNGVLKISMNISNTFSAEEVMVYLHYDKPIHVIDANEGSNIYSDDIIKQDKVTVKSQEAGVIKLHLDVDELKVAVYTGGQINLKGQANNQDVKSNTGGIYKAEELKTKSTKVGAYTGGIADIYATQKVEAMASTGGTITVLGDPEEIDKKESLGGYVRL